MIPRTRPPRSCVLAALLVFLPADLLAQTEDAARRKMVATIASLAGETARDTGRKIFDPRVMEAIGSVPRHAFVPEDQRRRAYDNRPLPIGHGQTISQPYIVALMTDLLDVQPGAKVLEVGTGSGYQAAILAALGARVFTIEIIPPLGEQAAERLKEHGYGSVTVRTGDGYFGWDGEAPFDSIIVTAAATHIPPPLVQQLKPGGRMVIPVGEHFLTQYLTLVEKDGQGRVTTRQLLPVAFVPLTGGRR